jgi:hypothetical protein
MTQPARLESNSLVKKRGSGVRVGSGVGVGAGVAVTGTGVCEGRFVPVGKREAAGVDVADWQAARKKRHPRRSFFMALITDCRITL